MASRTAPPPGRRPSELTEMRRGPEPRREDAMVLWTGEMVGRMVRYGVIGCSVCRKEFLITNGIVDFTGQGTGEGGRGRSGSTPPPSPVPAPADLQALLELSGPGGFVVLLGSSPRHAVGLAGF